MRPTRLVALLFGLVVCAAASAATQRAFVSTTGIDNPACSLAAPCRTFAAAVTATLAGGEVIVLDSGGYGPVTITQSVSIIAAPGVYAGISVFSGDGVTIDAALDKVVLRGLVVNGQGGVRGIAIINALQVFVLDCTVANVVGPGIDVAGYGVVYIENTVVRSSGYGVRAVEGRPTIVATTSRFVRNEGGGIDLGEGSLAAERIDVAENGNHGIAVVPRSGNAVSAVVTDSTMLRNGIAGAYVAPGLTADVATLTVVRSTSAFNSTGFTVFSNGPASALLSVMDSAATDNGTGLQANGAMATAIVSGSSLVRNGTADLVQFNGAVLRTAGNNAVTGRGPTDVEGTLTPNPLK